MQLSLLSRCPVPRRTGQWDRWDSMGQMGQAGQQEKQGRRSCLQDMKGGQTMKSSLHTAVCQPTVSLQNMGAYKPGPDFQSVPGCPKCPTVPAFRGRDSGTTVETKHQKSHEQLFITEI